MPIDPAIALAVRTPEPISPLQTIGGLMQMRDIASQIALRNAQTATQAQQAQDIAEQAAQRRRDNQSWNNLGELVKDKNVQTTLGKGDYSPIFNAGISPNVADQFIKNHQAMMEKAQTLQKGKADFYASGRQSLAAGLEGLDPQDDAIAASQYNGLVRTLAAEHPELAQQLPVLAAGPNFRQQIQNLAASNGVAHAILENQAGLELKQSERAKNTAQAVQATAEAGKATAETPGAQAESQRKQLVTKAMQDALSDPHQGAQLIDSALPASVDAQANSSYKAAWQAAMQSGNPEAAAHIVAAAAGHAAEISQVSNPNVIAGEVKKAVAVEQATSPYKIAQAVAQAKAMVGTGPTANVPPHLAVPAINAYEKASNEYAGALSAADEMKTIIDLARGGNKVAYAYAPTTGVLTINTANGVKRVNMAEIQQYGGAGSALDRIQGWLGKQTSGASIPPDVLNNMETLHGHVANNAADTYARKVQVVNGSYGSGFQPLQLPSKSTASAAPAPAASGKIRVKRKSDGAVGTLDPKDFDSSKYEKL